MSVRYALLIRELHCVKPYHISPTHCSKTLLSDVQTHWLDMFKTIAFNRCFNQDRSCNETKHTCGPLKREKVKGPICQQATLQNKLSKGVALLSMYRRMRYNIESLICGVNKDGTEDIHNFTHKFTHTCVDSSSCIA